MKPAQAIHEGSAAIAAAGRVRGLSSYLLENEALLLALAPHLGDAGSVDFESSIRGSSMSPAIPAGSRLRVRLRAPCVVGSVVFYRAGDRYMVHRVVHTDGDSSSDCLLTCGDDRLAPDPPVRRNEVLGTVTAVYKAGAWRPVDPVHPRSILTRAARAASFLAMRLSLRLGAPAARFLAVFLREFEMLGRGAASAVLRVCRRAWFEIELAASPLAVLLDKLRHPEVSYLRIDVSQVNALFPAPRRQDIARLLSETLKDTDNPGFFRRLETYGRRHRRLPRGLAALGDVYAPNLAALDFLAGKIGGAEKDVLLDIPCGPGVLLCYAQELGVARVHGFDDWSQLARSTAERFLEAVGMDRSVLVDPGDLSSLPVTIVTCVGFPWTLLAGMRDVIARPSVRYVLLDSQGRPAALPGFRRTGEYAGLLSVFQRADG